MTAASGPSGSYDPEGQSASSQLDFGDGTVVAPLGSPTASHIYAAGHWTAKLRITGWDGATATASATVDVAVQNQPPVANLTVTPTSGVAPLTVTADASGSFDSDGQIEFYRFDFGDGASLTQPAPVATRTYGVGTWVLTLTVTDDRGATRSTTSTIAVAPVPTPVDPPAASTPGNAVTLLRWCWEHRDIARYQELFTGDFRFMFAPGDTAGNAYQDALLSREDELTSASHLFAGGSATQPPASRIALTFAGVPQLVASPR